MPASSTVEPELDSEPIPRPKPNPIPAHIEPPWWLPLLSFFISWLHTIVIISFALLHTLGRGGRPGYKPNNQRCSLIQAIAPEADPQSHRPIDPWTDSPVAPPTQLLVARLWHFVRFQLDVQQSVKLFNRIWCIINLCAAESPGTMAAYSQFSATSI